MTTVPTAHTIRIGRDTEERDQFAAWLSAQGHTVTISRTTGSYVDEVWTDTDETASEIFNSLWETYCDTI